MTELLEQVWLRGEAEELGISVTPKQIATELANIKKENFKAPGSYQEFLKNSSFTPEDVERRVEVQILSTQIQEAISNSAGPASKDEIEAYYDAEKASQFTTPASRDVRVIINTDKSEVEKAKEALEKDNSPGNWNKVAAKYSTDPSTKGKGGLQTGVPEEFLKGELKKAVFETPTNQLAGPVKNSGSYLLVEPVKINPEKIQQLPEVRQQISSTLTQQNQEEGLLRNSSPATRASGSPGPSAPPASSSRTAPTTSPTATPKALCRPVMKPIPKSPRRNARRRSPRRFPRFPARSP